MVEMNFWPTKGGNNINYVDVIIVWPFPNHLSIFSSSVMQESKFWLCWSLICTPFKCEIATVHKADVLVIPWHPSWKGVAKSFSITWFWVIPRNAIIVGPKGNFAVPFVAAPTFFLGFQTKYSFSTALFCHFSPTIFFIWRRSGVYKLCIVLLQNPYFLLLQNTYFLHLGPHAEPALPFFCAMLRHAFSLHLIGTNATSETVFDTCIHLGQCCQA